MRVTSLWARDISLCLRHCFVLVAGALALRAEPAVCQAEASHIRVSLVTAGPAASPESWFGHVALLVYDSTTASSRLFEYGDFPSNAATVRGVISGHVIAYAHASDGDRAMQRLRAENRAILVQQLTLSRAQRALLLVRLQHDVALDRRRYQYDVLNNNCGSRVRDLLDDVTGGALRRSGNDPAPASLRMIGQRLLAHHVLGSIALEFLLNSDVDQYVSRYQVATIGSALADLAARTMVPGESGAMMPLATTTWQRTGGAGENTAIPPRADPVWFAGAAAGLTLLFLGAAARGRHATVRRCFGLLLALIGLLAGCAGLLLLYGWFFTGYAAVHHNQNLLLLSPLFLSWIPAGIALVHGATRPPRWFRPLVVVQAALAAMALLLRLLPGIHQDNLRIIAGVVPLLAAQALLVSRPHLRTAPRSVTAVAPHPSTSTVVVS